MERTKPPTCNRLLQEALMLAVGGAADYDAWDRSTGGRRRAQLADTL